MNGLIRTYAETELTEATSVLDNAQAALSTAQTALTAAKATETAEVQLFGAKEKELAQLRAKLASAASPSDATQILGSITALIIEQRARTQKVLDDREASQAAQADATFWQARVASAKVKLAIAESKLATITDEDTLRQRYRSETTRLAPLVVQAATLLASPSLGDASGQFDAMGPLVELGEHAHGAQQSALKVARQALENAEDQWCTKLDTDAGLDGNLALLGIQWRRAEAALADFALHAQERFDRATSILQGLAGPDPVLTDAEETDLALDATERTASKVKAQAVVDALPAVGAAQVVLDAAQLAAQAADPTVAGVPDVQSVRDAATALSNAETPLNDAKAALTAGDRERLEKWAVLVPDAAWRSFLAFQDASAILRGLSASDPAALIAVFDAAEAAYAQKLGEKAKSARALDFLGDSITLRHDRLSAVEAAQPTRLLSVIRGGGI